MPVSESLLSALKPIVTELRDRHGRVVVLTGAGVSAESGIPTFRGKDGYWVVGSRNYTPQEMATHAMFSRAPAEVWRWYLHRFGRCRAAEPNAAHLALAKLEQALGERFVLITQNIDGLHQRAGSSRERTYCIHGEAAFVRCAGECTRELLPLALGERADHSAPLSDTERARLQCAQCGGWLRPHVLWFDEYYDEHYYRQDSALRAVDKAALLLVVGTTGATSLPMHLGERALARGLTIVDVNPEPNPFSKLATASRHGFYVQDPACAVVPAMVDVFAEGV